MIKYQNVTNELVFSTRDVPQNCGGMEEQITVDNYNSGYKYFLELQCPNNKLYISKEIKFLDGVGTIELPDIVTQDEGKVFIQLVMRDETNDVVGKSLKARIPLYMINKSINAHIDLAKESRTGDFIEFLVKNNENMLKTKEDLDNKVASGYFKGEKGDTGLKGDKGEPGKDGTIINVGGNPQHQVSFTSNPQEQLDNKINTEQLNRLSLSPGNSKEFIFSTNYENGRETFIAPSNGYLVIEYEGTNLTVANNINFIVENYMLCKTVPINRMTPNGYEYFPLTRGQKVFLIYQKDRTNIKKRWFIFAKEVLN